MQTAIEVLEKAEAVLYRRIQRMRPGRPQTAAQYRLAEVRRAMSILNEYQRRERADNPIES